MESESEAVSVKCPFCGAEGDVPKDFVGKVIECPKCGKEFIGEKASENKVQRNVGSVDASNGARSTRYICEKLVPILLIIAGMAWSNYSYYILNCIPFIKQSGFLYDIIYFSVLYLIYGEVLIFVLCEAERRKDKRMYFMWGAMVWTLFLIPLRGVIDIFIHSSELPLEVTIYLVALLVIHIFLSFPGCLALLGFCFITHHLGMLSRQIRNRVRISAIVIGIGHCAFLRYVVPLKHVDDFLYSNHEILFTFIKRLFTIVGLLGLIAFVIWFVGKNSAMMMGGKENPYSAFVPQKLWAASKAFAMVAVIAFLSFGLLLALSCYYYWNFKTGFVTIPMSLLVFSNAMGQAFVGAVVSYAIHCILLALAKIVDAQGHNAE